MSSSGGGGSVGGGNNSDHQQANDEDILRGFDVLLDFKQNMDQDFGPAQGVPAANDGGAGVAGVAGGVNIPLYGGLETDYLLSLIQDSLTLKTSEIHSLLTRREMVISPEAANRPHPPALFMVRRPVVLNGVPDGYTWQKPAREQLQVNGVDAIEALYQENTEVFDRKMFRRIYSLIGQGDLFLVHYHLLVIDVKNKYN